MLYGKEASGVLVEVEYDNVQREVIKAAQEGHALKITTGEKIGTIFSDSAPKGYDSERRIQSQQPRPVHW